MRYRQLPLEQITATDRNIRKTVSEEGMAELTASIDRYGLLQPIVVFEVGEHEYEIVAGHRRYAACRELGWDTISAMVTKSDEQAGALTQAQENLVREDMTIEEELNVLSRAMQLVENVQREDVEQIEEAKALLRIGGGRRSPGRPLTNGDNCPSRAIISAAQLAALVGKSETWVKTRLSRILDLPDDVRSRVKKQQPGTGYREGLGINTAAEIARLTPDEDIQWKLASKVEQEQMTAPQTAAAVRKIKEDPENTEAVLSAKADDSSFDTVVSHKSSKVPAKQVPDRDKSAAEVVTKRFSQGYQKLLIAFEEDRMQELEADRDSFAEVCAEIAHNACYLRALLDNVIRDWKLDEKCDWSDEDAAEVATMKGVRVVSLEIVEDEEAT